MAILIFKTASTSRASLDDGKTRKRFIHSGCRRRRASDILLRRARRQEALSAFRVAADWLDITFHLPRVDYDDVPAVLSRNFICLFPPFSI